MQANVPAARATSLRTTTYLLASLLYSRTTYLLQADVGPRARAATQPRRLPLSVAWRLCRGVHWAVRPDAAGLVRPVHAWRAARAECLGALHDGALWGTSRGRLARWRAGARHDTTTYCNLLLTTYRSLTVLLATTYLLLTTYCAGTGVLTRTRTRTRTRNLTLTLTLPRRSTRASQ